MNDLSGMRFGRWTVVDRAPDRYDKNGYKYIMWNCVCECGNVKQVKSKVLTSGGSKSCGCLTKDKIKSMASKHSGYGTRLYNIWNSMRQRCNNPNHKSYHNYGGRGIKICEEWDDFSKFREWAYTSGYNDTAKRGECTLDRIDFNRDYTPSNCRFVDMKTQSNNKRATLMVEYNGDIKPLTEWAQVLGVKYDTLWHKYKRTNKLV